MRDKQHHHGGDVCGIVVFGSTVLSLLFLLYESYGAAVVCSRPNPNRGNPVKPSTSTLGQPLQKRLPTMDRKDLQTQIPHCSKGSIWHHHGDDVCRGSYVRVMVLSVAVKC